MIRRVTYILIMICLAAGVPYAGNAADNENSEVEKRNISLEDTLALFYANGTTLTAGEKRTHLEDLTTHLEKLTKKHRKNGTSRYFIERLFYQTHKKFLKEYENVVSYDLLVTEGKYNCVSGTALYALIFQSLNIPFTIYESPSHVLLMVQSDEGPILIESTDPLNGLVYDKKIISRHLESMTGKPAEIFPVNVGAKAGNGFFENPEQTITIRQLAGLQYYNEAVLLYQEGMLSDAYQMATVGYQLYKSERIKLCMDTVLDKILSSDKLTSDLKSQYLKQYISMVRSGK